MIEIDPDLSIPKPGRLVVVVGGGLVDLPLTNANIPAMIAAEIVAAAPIQTPLFVVFDEASLSGFGESCPSSGFV